MDKRTRQAVYVHEYTYGAMIYQPLNTVVLPMTVTQLVFKGIPIYPFPVELADNFGHQFSSEDVSAPSPTWRKRS